MSEPDIDDAIAKVAARLKGEAGRSCARCGRRPAKAGFQFCEDCFPKVKRQMEADGYLPGKKSLRRRLAAGPS
jgi:hypothetical protein